MVTDKVVLGAVSNRWPKGGLFASDWANVIGDWSVKHYQKYKKAPKKSITGYFETWSEKQPDGSKIKLVEQFLSSISDEYAKNGERHSSEFLIDEATKYFTLVAERKFHDEHEEAIESGDVDRLVKLRQRFNKVEIGYNEGSTLYEKKTIHLAIDDAQVKQLITYPGAAGKFFERAFVRDAFVAFRGKDKVGKSFWLLDAAYRALKQDRTVAFFETGDMSLPQIMRRFYARMARRPVFAKEDPVRYPTAIYPGIPPEVEFEERTFKKNMTVEQISKIIAKMKKQIPENRMRISCHPSGTININGIESIIESWMRGNWGPPDIIVIDYADILAGIDSRDDTRESLNRNYSGMRALSQKLHACLITAEQGDADSYDAELLGRSNFSGDKRRNAHVTGTVGINQDETEEKQEVYRLNWAVPLREREAKSDKVLYAASCRDVANPCVLSVF